MNLMLNLDVTVLVNRRVGDVGFVFFFKGGELFSTRQTGASCTACG